MKVKMRIRLIAPYGTYRAGEIVDLETDTAQRLIAENTAEAVPEEAYSSWPREGCTLAEALKRTTDADLLAAAALAEQKLAGAGGWRWPPHFIPFAFDDDDGFDDWKTSPADHQNAQFREAADKARAAIVDGFYRLVFDQRLVALGCFETSSAPPRVMTPRAWKSITVRSWRLSIARERTPKKYRWHDIRVFPALLAPNAEEILADRSLREAFLRFVLEDPEVVALRQPALKVAPQLAPVFLTGSFQAHGHEEWPILLDSREAVRLIHPDQQQRSPLGDMDEPDSPIVINAVDALVHRYNALMALLRCGKLEAESVPAAEGHPARIHSSIWSHKNFYFAASSGDVFEKSAHPASPDSAPLTRRWSAVMLRAPRPSASSTEVSATTAISNRSEVPSANSAVKRQRRRPVAEAVAKALKAKELEQRPASLTLKSIADIVRSELPKPPKTEHDLQALTKAIERYYRSKET